MHAADDRASFEPVAHDRRGELVEARPQLEVDVQPDVRSLVDEERERLVERRQLRSDLAQLLERERAHPASRGAVAHLVEVIGVREHERPARQVENVELDQVDAHLDRRAERAQRVLGSEGRRAAVTDAQHGTGRACRSITMRPPSIADDGPDSGGSTTPAARPTTIACATTIAAASFAVSCQNASG